MEGFIPITALIHITEERIRYEPEYATIASQAGSCVQEIQARTVGLTRWLTGKLNVENNFSMLDYGGADGKFLPNLPGEKYVFDISDIAPAEGIKRIHETNRDWVPTPTSNSLMYWNMCLIPLS